MKHYTAKYLLDPAHLVTVNLIGMGGTGSNVLQLLARLNEALMCFGHPGLHVYCWDGDAVSAANIGRQLFSPSDIGMNKAVCLVSRVNRYFGYSWEAVPHAYTLGNHRLANITITCTDTASSRLEINAAFAQPTGNEPTQKAYYWLDFGNSMKSGQVVLGTMGRHDQPSGGAHFLPSVVDMFGEQLHNTIDTDEPSCSLAEAINKQDLYVNSILANMGMQLLWKLFREGCITQHGVYVNLETMRVNPIPVLP